MVHDELELPQAARLGLAVGGGQLQILRGDSVVAGLCGLQKSPPCRRRVRTGPVGELSRFEETAEG